jgi:hypothetical protein
MRGCVETPTGPRYRKAVGGCNLVAAVGLPHVKERSILVMVEPLC